MGVLLSERNKQIQEENREIASKIAKEMDEVENLEPTTAEKERNEDKENQKELSIPISKYNTSAWQLCRHEEQAMLQKEEDKKEEGSNAKKSDPKDDLEVKLNLLVDTIK